MKRYQQLLLENKAWAQEIKQDDPEYFERMAKAQKPEILWIGCSDSRVSPTEITQTKPGEVFIHRNIANLVVHTDFNLLSVLQYAVQALEIKHVVVCGHYGCGGVKAALGNQSLGLIDQWLRHLKDTYRLHQNTVDLCNTEEERTNALVELNVKEQVYNLANTSIIQEAWGKRNAPYLHGWVYGLNDGIIKPILEIAPGEPLQSKVYEYDNLGAPAPSISDKMAS